MTGRPRRRGEPPQARALRIAREREQLDAAREEIRQGKCMSGPVLDAWLDEFADPGADQGEVPAAKRK